MYFIPKYCPWSQPLGKGKVYYIFCYGLVLWSAHIHLKTKAYSVTFAW